MGTKKLNVDSMFDPIEVTIEGATYNVVVTQAMLDATTGMPNEDELKKNPGKHKDIILKQIGIFLGEPPEKFKDTDVRKLLATVGFISGIIKEDLERSQKPSAES